MSWLVRFLVKILDIKLANMLILPMFPDHCAPWKSITIFNVIPKGLFIQSFAKNVGFCRLRKLVGYCNKDSLNKLYMWGNLTHKKKLVYTLMGVNIHSIDSRDDMGAVGLSLMTSIKERSLLESNLIRKLVNLISHGLNREDDYNFR